MTRVLFAGGGTAGHVEPALAVARQWRAQHPDSKITFVGTREGLEARLVPAAGFDLRFITKVRVQVLPIDLAHSSQHTQRLPIPLIQENSHTHFLRDFHCVKML